MKSVCVAAAILCFTFMGTWSAMGAESDDNTVIFYWENDVFSGTDRNYTNGFKLLWISGALDSYSEDRRLPDWSDKSIDSLPVINQPATTKHVGLSLGQKIYTPRDLDNPNLIPDDRPYAGWSYVGVTLLSKSERVLDAFELDLGLVGPQSYAREVQEEVHDLVDSIEPRGWDNQLKNEVGVNLVYERKWRLLQLGVENSDIFDFIPHGGMALGNVHTYANAGMEFRLGVNLPDDFGTGLIRPAGDASIPAPNARNNTTGCHLFAAVDGRAVLRNIFLDGNTFTDSHEVDRESFVADFMIGASVHFDQFKITYSHVYRTKEFETQEDEQIYGSVSISFTF
ncbi:MAG: lipid A deacylase LpxR family protein [Deltaproteobacteria bacterium]|nr:lipid A deacylase LpxR family protein [Deltaproteobacteria bacterium]